MNREIIKLRDLLNNALYLMIDAKNVKVYESAERHVYLLRQRLIDAYKDIAYSGAFVCDECGEYYPDREFDSGNGICNICDCEAVLV